ncbi:hypothetical protein WG66_016791 [Moniliophthora roreri]|nr:hypothetical protein WG66_016791 [Moniliophthora roreri]
MGNPGAPGISVAWYQGTFIGLPRHLLEAAQSLSVYWMNVKRANGGKIRPHPIGLSLKLAFFDDPQSELLCFRRRVIRRIDHMCKRGFSANTTDVFKSEVETSEKVKSFERVFRLLKVLAECPRPGRTSEA